MREPTDHQKNSVAHPREAARTTAVARSSRTGYPREVSGNLPASDADASPLAGTAGEAASSSAAHLSDRVSSRPPAIPDYELLQRIGVGGYGEVWLARSTATGALRAVKFVHRATFTDSKPFEREFAGLLKFEAVSRAHPSQLALFHVGRDEAAGWFYYVMELADPAPAEVISDQCSVISDQKRALAAETTRHAKLITDPLITDYSPRTLRSDLETGRLPAARVLELGLALTEALAHLHGHGLVHRDLKPSNLIFVDGRPKLADIGLVTDASDARSFVGTEGYLPPEGPGKPAADIFALGKVLYEALTGLDRRQFSELPADLRQWPDAALAFELNTIVVKACAANARERYANAEALLADLKLLDAGKSVKRRRAVQRGWTWTWKMAAVLALVGLGALLIRTERPKPPAVSVGDPRSFKNSGTTNLAAWQTYQRAYQMISPYTVTSMSNAVLEFERALVIDPNYARAWSTMSITLTLAVEHGYLPANRTLPRAKLYAQTAIEKGGPWAFNHLAQASLGLDYDFAKAERMFRKGIAAAPDYWALRSNFARFLVYQGRFEEAEKLLNEILRDNPDGTGFRGMTLPLLYLAMGRIPEARSSFEVVLRLDPARPAHYVTRADFLLSLNERAAGARDLLRVVELDGFPSLDAGADGAVLRQMLTEQGPEEFLRHHIRLLEERLRAGQWVYSFDLARLYAHAGDRIKALDYLERAVEEHGGMVLSAKVNPAFKSLDDEPRYHAVLRRLKLER